jgi:DnaJ-class molecular chaperone
MRQEYLRVVCPECLGAGEFETTTSHPEATEPPTVLCRNCFGRGYVFAPKQMSFQIPEVELPEDYDPFAMEEETDNERDACKV